MICGCIDIGSNTTRLLVAETSDGSLRELTTDRAFTRLGKAARGNGSIPADKIEETVAVVVRQARVAHELGADEVVAVATAAIRTAANRDELCNAVERAIGRPLTVLDGDEEARLSFVGAARTLPDPAEGVLAVVDVGGGSTEIAVGSPEGQVEWACSFGVGSGSLADTYLGCDPPSATELTALREHVAGVFEDLEAPRASTAVAVGGTATSLRRLVGAELACEALERGVRVLSATPIAEVALRFELEPERVRLLPAGILVLQAVSGALGLPLTIAHGGLREGVLLELSEAG